ncbi:hypothetical protein I7F13_04915 [Sinorhizobium meliloti]|uniref:hypothetical protein n=1 Tax=Rhizobium meliloti TaxID=382 RepID=UPI000FD7FB41|nr:hypothetical protein [Sinorhizobium meliloti]MDE3821772.1 hypothetical protein [Sinorhizobium meliloti]RVM40398.1 hypothetical protein CN127_31825 [Sinorhizobium meliloti]RVN55162.1 hypothetical protein CN106_35200 [Sinorhizobium meliloti]
MKELWRMAFVSLIMGLTWFVCEYVSVTSGVVLVAGLVALLERSLKDRLDDIGKALEMHSRKVFPELWN